MKVIIVGGGKVGTYIASLLLSNGNEVTIIDNRENNYQMLVKEFPEEILIYGNGSNPAVLESAEIDNADVVAAVTQEDEMNLVVSTLAKMEFGVPRVVARVNNPKNAWLFNSQMGVDIGINQADLMAHFIVEEMDLNDMFTLMKLNRSEYSIVQMKISDNAKAINHMLKDLSIPKNAVLISITRNDVVVIPKGDTIIMQEDEILILTDEASRKELKAIFA
jgi:trk system potassium uptake protein TrkA